MATVLVLNSSVNGDASVSKQLVKEAVDQLRAADPSLRFVTRDLGLRPLPHLTMDAAQVIRGVEAVNEAQAAAVALSNLLIAELQGADIIIIGVPMYNFGVPAALKSWFDYIIRAGVTFRYNPETGLEGLVKGKRAVVIMARGGVYSEGPAKMMDSQEPHLRTMLGFIGITDVAYVRAEKLGMGPEAREEGIRTAQAELSRLSSEEFLRAA